MSQPTHRKDHDMGLLERLLNDALGIATVEQNKRDKQHFNLLMWEMGFSTPRWVVLLSSWDERHIMELFHTARRKGVEGKHLKVLISDGTEDGLTKKVEALKDPKP
jgi:hypothetical protein